MKKVIVILITFIFFNFNVYAENFIKHKKNIDGSDTFDISFMFNTEQNVKKNFHLLTDFENIHKLNPSVFKTEILSKDVDKIFLKTTFRDCVLFFCREMTMYEYIFSYCENNSYCVIQLEVIPKDDSPVVSGKTVWKIKSYLESDSNSNLRAEDKSKRNAQLALRLKESKILYWCPEQGSNLQPSP